MEGQSPGLRSSLPTSPRRKISDTLQLLTSTKSPCTCQGHHWIILLKNITKKKHIKNEKNVIWTIEITHPPPSLSLPPSAFDIGSNLSILLSEYHRWDILGRIFNRFVREETRCNIFWMSSSSNSFPAATSFHSFLSIFLLLSLSVSPFFFSVNCLPCKSRKKSWYFPNVWKTFVR